jgi:hypothetical protein
MILHHSAPAFQEAHELIVVVEDAFADHSADNGI